MNFRYTKYSLVNALWSLIPIFPVWTLFPGILIASGIEQIINNCKSSYIIILWLSIISIFILVFSFILKSNKHPKKSNKEIKNAFRLCSLLIYTLVNTSVLILLVGVNLACNGDGQTFLNCIYSGPLASISIIVFGLICDLKI